MSPWLVLVPVGVLAGFLAFVWQRLAVAPAWRPRWVRYAVALVLLALTALALAGFDVWGGSFTPAQLRPAVWVGQAFLATCLYLFLGLVPVWLVCVCIWLVRWPHDHGRDGRQRLNRVASPLVAVVALAVTAYGAVEAANPSVTRFEVSSPELPSEFDGVRVALVTDLHAGAVRSASFTRQVVDLVNAEHPDLVVIAGDLVDGDAARYSPEIAPLADLEAPLGVFATTGNHEMFRDTANWVTAFQAVGLTVLQNSSVPLERDGATITLAGVHDLTGEGRWAPDYDAALARTDAGAFTLFAAHQPLQALDVEGRGVDVQLSGHTHGGQMWPINYLVPLQQPMLEGKATVGDTTVVTSRGAGAWGPAIRVAAPPEVPIITLRRS
ncbi:MAG TPA: metallophosphoesterase [Ornithinibacter sp.]|nr:metallophosphoesterase [Ornithinibacter sp.]